MIRRLFNNRHNFKSATAFLLMVFTSLFTFLGKDLENCILFPNQRISWCGISE
jgi:hypothetical protein